MVQENEAITLLLGVMTLAFLIAKRKEIILMPGAPMLILAFLAGLVAWTATVVEEIAFPHMFNILEHVSYAVSSVLLAVWCWRSRDTRARAAQS